MRLSYLNLVVGWWLEGFVFPNLYVLIPINKLYVLIPVFLGGMVFWGCGWVVEVFRLVRGYDWVGVF